MSNNYLLPCDCGHSVTVGTSQAGQVVTCVCGRRLTVPSLRAIRQLQPALDKSETKSNARTGSWNPIKGAMFAIGAILILGGLLIAAHSYSVYSQAVAFQPSTVAYDASLEAIEEMSPTDLLETWQMVKEHGLEQAGSSPFVIAQVAAREKLRMIYAGLIVAAVGFLAAVAPVFISGK